MVHAPGELHRAILAQNLPLEDRLAVYFLMGCQDMGGETCGQLMCVTESGAHTGSVLGASANFISDTNVTVVIEGT